ncbi:hypothetical protein, partial [Streptomyces reticuliscabiei]|uniref:hypothetical protein n=1 Tax=Streptomyces reticuliscabiei TaxID=146821 RepID=UPI001C4EA4EC
RRARRRPAGRPGPALSGQLGLGETAVFITAIVAVTLLAVLERPVPGILTALASAACLLLGRAGGS